MKKKAMLSMSTSISDEESRSMTSNYTSAYCFHQFQNNNNANAEVFIQSDFLSTIQGGWLIEIDPEPHSVYCVLKQNCFIVKNHPKSEQPLHKFDLDKSLDIKMKDNLIMRIKKDNKISRYQFNDPMDQVRWDYALLINQLNIRFQIDFTHPLNSKTSFISDKDTYLYNITISLLEYLFKKKELNQESNFPFYEFTDFFNVEKYIVVCDSIDQLNVSKEDNSTSTKSQQSDFLSIDIISRYTDSYHASKRTTPDNDNDAVTKLLEMAGTFLSIVLTNSIKIKSENDISNLNSLHDYISNWLNIAVDPVYFRKRYLRLENLFADALFSDSNFSKSHNYFKKWLSTCVSSANLYISIAVNCLNSLFDNFPYFPFKEFAKQDDVDCFKNFIDDIDEKPEIPENFLNDFMIKNNIEGNPDQKGTTETRIVETFLYNVILNASVFEEGDVPFPKEAMNEFKNYLCKLISHFYDKGKGKKDCFSICLKIDILFSQILYKNETLPEFLEDKKMKEIINAVNPRNHNRIKGYQPIKRRNCYQLQSHLLQKQHQINVDVKSIEKFEKVSQNDNEHSSKQQLVDILDLEYGNDFSSSQRIARSIDGNNSKSSNK